MREAPVGTLLEEKTGTDPMPGMTNPAELITPTPELLTGRTLGTRNKPETIYLWKGVISPITAEGMIVAPLAEAYLLAMCMKLIVGRPTQLFHMGEKVDLEILPVKEWSFLRLLLELLSLLSSIIHTDLGPVKGDRIVYLSLTWIRPEERLMKSCASTLVVWTLRKVQLERKES